MPLIPLKSLDTVTVNLSGFVWQLFKCNFLADSYLKFKCNFELKIEIKIKQQSLVEVVKQQPATRCVVGSISAGGSLEVPV
jgi:hypothetical protein